MYQELVSYLNFNPQTTRRVDDKGFSENSEFLLNLFKQLSVNDWYICETGGLPTGSTYWVTVFRTEKGILFYHNDIIYFVSNTLTLGTFQTDVPDENTWKEVFKLIGYP